MYAAVIVETRKISNLDTIIGSHMDKLPNDFQLIAFNANDFSINSLYDYNTLLTSISFWSNLLKYDRVLIFQQDSGILREGIEEFYQWDYIGAPWQFQDHGGNGGLSLRNPKAMIKTIMNNHYNPSAGNEDIYFSNHLIGNLAPRSECKKFSVESEFILGTFGYHFGDDSKRYLSDDQIEEIKNQ